MGASQPSQPVISSPMWEFGGFGRGDEILDAGSAGTRMSFTLKPWAGTEANRALKFTDPVSGEVYYIELRLPVGYDSAVAVNGNRGVKVVQALGAGSIALQPSTLGFPGYYGKNQAWQPGQTFTTHAGTRVSIDWLSSTAAGVTIESVAGVAARAIAPVASATASLGNATSGVLCGLRDGGCYQAFEGGTVHWVPGVGAYATWGGIRATWGALGYENGKLGYPVTNEICGLANGGCYQGFQGGTIHYAPGIGAYATWGGIRTSWGALGYENGKLGYPVTNEICGLANGGCYQGFQGGTIHYAPGIGAYATWGGIRATWGALGYENGKLGYPVTNEICGLVNGGCYQGFQNGTIHYAPGIGAYATWGGIRATWGALGYENGKLGYPVTNEICGLVNGGCYQGFQNGTIHYAPGIGAYATSGPIRATWGTLGYEKGKLGYPVTNEICGLVNGGCYQGFQNGTIHYAPGIGAYATSGPIRATWGTLGYEKGKLGYPTGVEVCGLVNGGCSQDFQGGAIHYAPGIGAHATWGGIRTTWGTLGYENGKLGYPVTNEICGLVNGGCYQGYQNGTIHYAPGIGAYATSGPIRATWGTLGYENGKLGYPVTNEICGLVNGGCYQGYQNGTIHYVPGIGAYATWGRIRTTWGTLGYENGKLGYPVENPRCDAVSAACVQRFQHGNVSDTGAVSLG
ncbi:hypothetical protein [Arthrobacter sp. UKPF54-2]|uniref:hypothetical protein n=1 Tax=Arthrobacter sp. UKPF54-2 TaxID=2600159 RepID=UPI0021BD3232|nr:hypothetical protein [Arthrobacter sp. UKPF54-2]